jgi:hypothetical protein
MQEETAMSEPSPPASGAQGGQQLNRILGDNTVFFHQTHALPTLQPTGAKAQGVPNPGVFASAGGTPNQKAERLANRIAFFHFVQPNAGQAASAVSDTIAFFQGQLQTGHQCIFNADEALTPSHSPIWWRAITSLRITTHALAGRGGDNATLASLVLDWIQFHTSLNRLGEIRGGPNAGKVLLPGSRTKGNPDPSKDCFCVTVQGGGGKNYPKEPLTDQVNNVVHQLIMTGAVPWDLPAKVFLLRDEAQDLAGVALAKQIVTSGVGFGNATSARLPQLRSRLVVERFSNGHRARFPDGMPCAVQPALEAYADYETGQLCVSRTVGGCPPPAFAGQPETTEVEPVPLGTADCGHG